jgi:hypothetical protein
MSARERKRHVKPHVLSSAKVVDRVSTLAEAKLIALAKYLAPGQIEGKSSVSGGRLLRAASKQSNK